MPSLSVCRDPTGSLLQHPPTLLSKSRYFRLRDRRQRCTNHYSGNATFRTHMVKTAAKVRTRNNLITKQAGSTWRASSRILRTATLALCFSVAEYCAPVWCRSSHKKLVDIQLNSAMRTISGSIMSTPVPWLTVLSNIAPAAIRRMSASVKAMDKIRQHPNLPVFDDVIAHPEVRLQYGPQCSTLTDQSSRLGRKIQTGSKRKCLTSF